jgi:hypothetical protein
VGVTSDVDLNSLYGCECWMVHLLRLEVFQMGCLRQILGLSRLDHVFTIIMQ